MGENTSDIAFLHCNQVKRQQCKIAVPVGAEEPAEPVPVPGGGVALRVRPHLIPIGPRAVAVNADDKSALAAGPVLVEQGGLAHVAHLPDPLDHALPGHREVLRQVDGHGLLLLPANTESSGSSNQIF